jgi:hypothetical protein
MCLFRQHNFILILRLHVIKIKLLAIKCRNVSFGISGNVIIKEVTRKKKSPHYREFRISEVRVSEVSLYVQSF